ncbi:hypothetical protein L2E82_11282 [Cichorium intybus]|uniref:Uncharacterized protein n=1 Tax=Cichorium intybus TaxID=13427 RepID=A0ACB9GDK5_CICIN|nr:hypothetical protein L2E82_11282 [Cichorium intybus]
MYKLLFEPNVLVPLSFSKSGNYYLNNEKTFSGNSSKHGLTTKHSFGKVKYVLRPVLLSGCQSKSHHCGALGTKDRVNLGGYGVELALKNMEYKAMDDSEIKKGVTLEHPHTEYLSQEVRGFIFSKILHESRASEIEECQKELSKARALVEAAERSLEDEVGDKNATMTETGREVMYKNKERFEFVKAASNS